MTEGIVLAAHTWRDNSELMMACRDLGYIPDAASHMVLDTTYGKGTWWKHWAPQGLATNDKFCPGASWAFDFRHLPAGWRSFFHAVAYDPPYVSKGGRGTKCQSMADHQNRYGLTDAPKSPDLLQRTINDGLGEVHRVLRPGGFALVKCQDYVSSGKLYLGTHHTLTHALELGFTVQDRLEFISKGGRPQPPRTRKDGKPSVQQHARRNYSTLLVLKKGKA